MRPDRVFASFSFFLFLFIYVAADTLSEGRRPSQFMLTKDVDVDGTKTRLNNRIQSSGNTIIRYQIRGEYKNSSNANVFDDGTELFLSLSQFVMQFFVVAVFIKILLQLKNRLL